MKVLFLPSCISFPKQPQTWLCVPVTRAVTVRGGGAQPPPVETAAATQIRGDARPDR